MLNENEERFHPKQSSSINTGAAQRKETNKTLKTLNKVYFMKGFEGFKKQMNIKRNSQKTKLSFTWFFYGNLLWALLFTNRLKNQKLLQMLKHSE